MRIGTMGNAINDGTIDQIVAEARQVADDGLHTYWVPQIFGHDALTALAVVAARCPASSSAPRSCPPTPVTR